MTLLAGGQSDAGAEGAPAASRLALWHGRALVAAAALVPIGEGAAFAALAALGVVLLLRRRELSLDVLRRGPLAAMLVALAVWLAAGGLAVVLGGEGWLKPGELGRWAPLLAVPLVVLSATVLPRRVLEQAAAAFIVALAVAAVFGLVQYTFNVRPGESLSRLESGVAGQARVPGRYDRTVAGGFYFHRLKMAHVLVVGIAVLASRQLFARLRPYRRAIELTVLGVFGLTLLLTFARGALLALAVGGALTVPFAARRVRFAALAGLALSIALALAIPSVRERIRSIAAPETSAVRALVWSQGVRVIADHPFGVGIGNYPAVIGRYYDASDPTFSVRTYPHNLWLAAWAETGPVGVLAYTLAWAVFVAACLRRLRRGLEHGRVAAGAGLLGVTAVLVIGLTHDVLFHNAVALAVLGLVGFVLALLGPEEPAAAGECPR